MKGALLWAVAVVLMLAAVVYQRITGPTYPVRGTFEAGTETYAYRLPRSATTTGQARIALPDPGDARVAAGLTYKRYATDDSLTTTAFVREGDEWVAFLPVQPAAGKMAYVVTLTVDGHSVRVPAEGEVILRYKDPVPAAVLVPHILLMFFSILIGIRAGLAALFAPDGMRNWTYLALVGMTLGGMILGPIVQHYAFGAYWTGFPFGGDLTDNKTLIMWGCWVVAAGVIGLTGEKKKTVRRAVVGVAAVVMTVVYLIPHSVQGSELDYSRVDQGVPPTEAIETGN